MKNQVEFTYTDHEDNEVRSTFPDGSRFALPVTGMVITPATWAM